MEVRPDRAPRGCRVLMSIPPELAYGNKAAQDAQAAQAGGAQRQQNPAGTLVFVVEIVDSASSQGLRRLGHGDDGGRGGSRASAV